MTDFMLKIVTESLVGKKGHFVEKMCIKCQTYSLDVYHQRSRDSSSVQRLLKVLIKDIFSLHNKLKIGKIIIYFDFVENVLFTTI